VGETTTDVMRGKRMGRQEFFSALEGIGLCDVVLG
jgi:hypothetical protein